VLVYKSLLQVSVDYEGFLFERTEPFCSVAENLMQDPRRHNSSYGIDYFANAAFFEKSGFYAIFVQVLLSLHFNHLAKSEEDVIGICIYFGCFNNGTMQLAKVWTWILVNIKFCVDLYWDKDSEEFQSLLRILFHADYTIFKKSGKHGVKKDKWVSLIGNSKAYRFQKDSTGSTQIHSHLPNLIDAVEDVLEYSRSFHKKYKEIHHRYISRLSSISGIGGIRLNQLLHCLCLSGLLPIQCMTDFVTISKTANPGKVLKNITVLPLDGTACQQPIKKRLTIQDTIDNNFAQVIRNLSSLKLDKVSHDYLENLLCEMYRHFSPITQKKLAKLTGETFVQALREELSCPSFYKRVEEAQLSPNNDLYFKDFLTGTWQHLFRITSKHSLVMRPSTVVNTVSASCILHLKVHIDQLGAFCANTTSSHEKDLSVYFLK